MSFEGQDMKQQTFTFTDASKEHVSMVDSGNDPTFRSAATYDTNLASWLERPLLVRTLNWTVGQDFPEIYFNPWSTYLENPTVVQKLNNFKFLRCKMNMKITVAGSQMHYGRGMVSYRPMLQVPGDRYQASDAFNFINVVEALEASNIDTYAYTSNTGTTGFDFSAEVCKSIQSQWPKIFIDPGQSTGGCMQFPFIFQSNYFDLNKRDWIVNNQEFAGYGGVNNNGSSIADPENSQVIQRYVNFHSNSTQSTGCPLIRELHMGVVHSSSMAPLLLSQATNSSEAEPVTIQIFLWASDVELAVPTSVPMTGISSYEPPVELQSRTDYVPDLMGELSHANNEDGYMRRATFDPALLDGGQETAGAGGDDEMSIANLAGRETYYSWFEWDVNDSANTLKYQMKVTPRVYLSGNYRSVNSPALEEVYDAIQQHSAMSYCSLPFTHWKGTIKYRFQIVASNFHRGKLRVVYDPTFDALATVNSTDYREDLTNTQYQRVIDLGSENGRDFTMEISYMQPRPYLPFNSTDAFTIPINQSYPTTREISRGDYGQPISGRFGQDSSCNGMFSIYVLNELCVNSVTTDPNNNVRINIFVSGGDDLEFQGPTDTELSSIDYTLPTGFGADYQNTSFVRYERQREVRSLPDQADPVTIVGKYEPKVELQSDSQTTSSGDQDQAVLGSGEDENVPEEPETTIEVGEESIPINNVFFGENFTSFRPLMDRWTMYSNEAFPHKASDFTQFNLQPPRQGSLDDRIALNAALRQKYTGTEMLKIEPNFPPYPGPGIQFSAFQRKTLYSPFTEQNLPQWEGWFATAYPALYQRTGVDSPATLPENSKFVNSPVPPNKAILAGNFRIAQVPDDVGVPTVQSIPAEDYTDALTTNPGNLTMLHFVSKLFLGTKGSIRNKYVVAGGDSWGATSELMVVKRLPENHVLAPVVSLYREDYSTTEPPSVNEGAIWSSNTPGTSDDFEYNMSWPACYNQWNQCFMSRPLSSDITDYVAVIADKYRQGELADSQLPTYQVQGTQVVEAFKTLSEGVYNSAVNTLRHIAQKTGADNVVPFLINANAWPYFNSAFSEWPPTAPDGSTQRVCPQPGSDLRGAAASSQQFPLRCNLHNLFPGSVANSVRHQPVVEAEIPFYVNKRFNLIPQSLGNTSGCEAHSVYVAVKNDPANAVRQQFDEVPAGQQLSDNPVRIERWVRPGTDFSLFYLLNVPTIYRNSKWMIDGIPGEMPEATDFNLSDGRIPYGSLPIYAANRSETALPGYRGVNQNYTTVPGNNVNTIRYIYRNRSRNCPYYTNFSPMISDDISFKPLVNSVL